MGDSETALLCQGKFHSSDRWREVLAPSVQRYRSQAVMLLFRGDAAFAKPEVYQYLQAEKFGYAIQFPSNDVL